MFLTIGPDNNTGFRKHLEELSFILEEYPSKFIAVKERGSKATLNKIKFYRPKLTIIGGRNWIKRNHKILERIPGKKGILFCSPLAQAEISGEEIYNLSIYLAWLDSKRIDYLFVGSKTLAEMLDRKEVIHLPAPSISDLRIDQRRSNPQKNIVALFNDKAVHKNILNTVAGASRSHNMEEFWINGASEEYQDIFKRLVSGNRIKYIGFMSKKELYKKLSRVKLLLQISLSESFSYSSFEALNLGIPVIVSNAIPWVKINKLKVRNPEDLKEIALRIDYVLSLNKSDYAKLSKRCRDCARQAISFNNKTCEAELSKILF